MEFDEWNKLYSDKHVHHVKGIRVSRGRRKAPCGCSVTCNNSDLMLLDGKTNMQLGAKERGLKLKNESAIKKLNAPLLRSENLMLSKRDSEFKEQNSKSEIERAYAAYVALCAKLQAEAATYASFVHHARDGNYLNTPKTELRDMKIKKSRMHELPAANTKTGHEVLEAQEFSSTQLEPAIVLRMAGVSYMLTGQDTTHKTLKNGDDPRILYFSMPQRALR